MGKKRAKKTTFSETLRQAIEDSGLSRYRISQETGIEQSALSRFMSGKTGLSTSTIDKLAELLGLELVVRGPKKKKGGE